MPGAVAPILSFPRQHAWKSWLHRHHATSSGVWLRLAKKGAATPSVSYAEALDVALCYGWIDGQRKSDSAQTWLQKFTPRSSRSIWSKINRQKALTLIAEKRMHPAGLAEIKRAQADGRWEAAYDSQRGSTVPEDLRNALSAHPTAQAFFATLSSQNRYAILFRIQTARKAETRAKRIAQFVAMLKKGETLHP